MTNLDTQTLIALVCVTVAAIALCRRVVLWWKGPSTGCGGGCHGCGPKLPEIKVPLTVLSESDERLRQRIENEK